MAGCHERTSGVLSGEEHTDTLGLTLDVQGEEKQQEEILLPLSGFVSYRDDGGIIRHGHQRDPNRKEYVPCLLCMKDKQSIYIFMKIMCIPIYLPDALLDHIKLDNEMTWRQK